ncbi:MAG: glycosyltransferase N-terminal domain-containing protein [Alphaproteobacteria bacterium]
MTASLALYTLGTRIAEPVAPFLLEQRRKRGKERADRIGERLGVITATRPASPLLWMHGASVGESRLLIDLFNALRARRPDLSAVVTTQTLTSADMISAWAPPGVVHQMATVDAPGAVGRFLAHWRPEATVFAEGEIWPNMLAGLRARSIPAALVNARMTTRTLRNWNNSRASAREIFSAFGFIGAADTATATGLGEALGRHIGVVGNLKRAGSVERPSADAVAAWRNRTAGRKILLAASTHPGEDELALDAFAEVRAQEPDALLIIVPRHPERGAAVTALARARGLTAQLRSADPSDPQPAINVLVADTIGELVFWYAASDAIYLGGANAGDVGGHNAIEPAQLGKRVFTGPHGYNFRETFEALGKSGAVTIGATAKELADYWRAALQTTSAPPSLDAFFAEARAPFDASLDAVLAMLPPPASAPR